MTQAFNLSQLANRVNTSGQLDISTGASGTLPIANGGTNNGSLAVTAGGVIYTDGSKAVNVGAGTSGQLLQSNGASAPTWVAPPVAGLTTVVLTSSTTWTKPIGVQNFYVAIHAGGGGGGGDSFSQTGGAGGMGGWAYAILTTAQIPSTVTVTIGNGGGAYGGVGGSSSFGSLMSATGGGGGTAVGANGANGSGTVSTGTQLGVMFFSTGTGGVYTMPNPLTLTKNIQRPRGLGGAVSFNIADVYWAGAGGQGDQSTLNNPSGGIGGACIIVY